MRLSWSRSLLTAVCLVALVVSSSADDLGALNASGVEHYKAGRFAEAIDAFEQALAQSPEETTVKTNLGRSYQALGLARAKERALSDAADLYRKAADAMPEEMEPRILHAETLAQLDRVDDGISALAEALRLLPPTARATRSLGFLHYRASRRDDALTRWRESLELEPNQADLREWVARVEREAESERNFARSASSVFVVHYDQRDRPDLARAALDMLQEALRDVSAELGLFPGRNVEVVVLPDRTFREMNEVPAWVGGLFDGRIKFPAGNLDGDQESLRRMTRHELTHALLHQTVRGSPAWLEEGLAQIMEGAEPGGADERVRAAARDGRLVPMERLSGSFVGMDDTEAVRLAYAQSLSFTRWLRERHGKYAMRLFLDRLAAGDAPAAFQEAFGAPLGEVEESWRNEQ